MTPETRLSLLTLLLRLAGCVTVAAFFAVLLPVEWMASSHQRLGLGEFPRAPIVVYLARSIAGLYGFHGVLLLLVSSGLMVECLPSSSGMRVDSLPSRESPPVRVTWAWQGDTTCVGGTGLDWDG